jgi:enoyl-[acyl-carrier protein] reductase III
MSSTADSPFSLAGRNALVVGGSRGIGRAIALQFARAGAAVVVNYVRDRAAADALVAEAEAAGLPLRAVRADVTGDRGREELVAGAGGADARFDAIVFAAATGVHRGFEGLTGRHFDFTFALNVKAFLWIVQTFAPRMPEGGSIIALSSEGAERAMPSYGLVGASKGALEALARHLAVELAPRGVRVNVLSPGTVATDAWSAMPDAQARLTAAAARTPKGRLTTLEEVALCAQFLASDAAAGIVGQTLVVDGGARIVGSG